MRLTFLGTSAAAPTAYRNLSGLFLKREGQSFLFDCGEGTQRQMIRYGTGFSLDAVFFTHFHADHYLGIIGFVRTLGMLGRTDPLVLYGPRPASTFLPKVLKLGAEEANLPVEVVEVSPGTVVRGDGYRVEAFATDHRVPSVGYALIEDERPGRFDIGAARALGVPEGPLFGRLQHGERIILPDGRDVSPEQVIGPPRPGRRVIVSGDTRPCDATTRISQGADLIVHEATFGDFEQARAVDTRHSTAREAARVAREAGARRLVLTHLSTRYDREPGTLLDQAKEVFEGVEVAEDGLVIDLPQHD